MLLFNKSLHYVLIVLLFSICFSAISEYSARNELERYIEKRDLEISLSYENRYKELESLFSVPLYLSENDGNSIEDYMRAYRQALSFINEKNKNTGRVDDYSRERELLKTLKDVGLDLNAKREDSIVKLNDPLLFIYINLFKKLGLDSDDLSIRRFSLPIIPFLSDSYLFFIALTVAGALGASFRSINKEEYGVIRPAVIGLCMGFCMFLILRGGIYLIFSDPRISMINFNIFTNTLLSFAIGFFNKEVIKIVFEKAGRVIEVER